MAKTYGASSVLMPDQGWFLFGGNELNTSQKLMNIDSKWEEGLKIPFLGIIYHCVVQVRKLTKRTTTSN